MGYSLDNALAGFAAVGMFIVTYILPCAVIAGVALVAYAMAKSLVRTFSSKWKAAGSRKADTVSSMLLSVVKWSVVYFAAAAILGVFGIANELILAVTGIFSVALGFALQSFVRDFIAGGSFLASDAFNVGDVISAAGVTGKVQSIGLARTILVDAEGSTHIVPNGSITIITKINITDENRGKYLTEKNAAA
ncbi:MAG: mechanosensitive ion channel family protein [Clostridiales bacterium]|jgi:small conductance mechanosensitive channel|nr:mechanosensitive ion channel family protein [Clostridiales bacterium]